MALLGAVTLLRAAVFCESRARSAATGRFAGRTGSFAVAGVASHAICNASTPAPIQYFEVLITLPARDCKLRKQCGDSSKELIERKGFVGATCQTLTVLRTTTPSTTCARMPNNSPVQVLDFGYADLSVAARTNCT